MDVAALREELIVTEARKKGAAQMYARGAIDAEQLETITAEPDQATGSPRRAVGRHRQEPAGRLRGHRGRPPHLGRPTLGRKREVLRHLITVTLPPLGRGHVFTRDLIQIGPATVPGSRAAPRDTPGREPFRPVPFHSLRRRTKSPGRPRAPRPWEGR